MSWGRETARTYTAEKIREILEALENDKTLYVTPKISTDFQTFTFEPKTVSNN